MALNDTIDGLLEKMRSSGAPTMDQMSVEDARAFTAAMGQGVEVEEVDSVEGDTIRDVPVTIYRDRGVDDGSPIFIWLHGGGFVLGDVPRDEVITRRLANRVAARIVSVEYRRAPEHPYPAALEDARVVFDWAADQGVPIGVGGDSAGANLAARLAVEARDRGVDVRHQLLVYPWVDLAMTQPSIRDLGDDYFLTRALLEWFRDHYLPSDVAADDPVVSPFYVEDLGGVAAATVIVPEYDPLRDEGIAFARRLDDAGVDVVQTTYPGMIHGFFRFFHVVPDVAADANDAAAERVRAALTEKAGRV